MDVKKVIEFDKDIAWKKQHGNNPYAMVFNATRIWRFTEDENKKKYIFLKLLIQDHAIEFRWGLHKQKKIMVFYHKKFAYFVAPPNYVYKLELPEQKKSKKKNNRNNYVKNIFVE